MKVSIIIPPWLHPTAPTLGPACLAAFLKREAKDAMIKVFDLNLRHYYQAFDYLKHGRIGLRLYNWDTIETTNRVINAFEFLKSHPFSSVKPERWHKQATIFLSFENIFNGFIEEMAARCLAGLELPQGIDKYFQRLVDPVAKFRPDICAISIFFDAQMLFGLAIAQIIKHLTGSFVCLGGARFGTNPDPARLFKKGITIKAKGKIKRIREVSWVDAIIPGEGELPLYYLLKAAKSNKMHKIPGVIIQKNPGHFITDFPPSLNMNELPCPDFSDVPLGQYMVPSPVLPFMTSRGCAWGKCTFCTHHKIYKRYRQMNTDRAIEQIKELRDSYKVTYVNIFDEMIPPARFRRLSNAILQEKIDITFSAYAKPTKAFDKKLLNKIQKAGGRVMLWGIESGSQEILQLMKKGTKVEEMEQVLKNSSEAGIRNLVFIMFGFPGEAKDDFQMTIDFLQRNQKHIHAISKGLFMLVEGCEAQKRPERFFIRNMKALPDNCGGARSFEFETLKGLNPSEAASLYKKSLPIIERIGLSPRLAVYREHLLF